MRQFLPSLESLPFGCKKCRSQWEKMPISMAFQPIVDVEAQRVFAHEALVRGIKGEPAGTVLDAVPMEERHSLDQLCRATAIREAARLGMDTHLSINFLPTTVYNPVHCLRTTLAAAEAYEFPLERIILEVTESEEVEDRAHLQHIVATYQEMGLRVAIDDFGAGHSGLSLLAEVNPDIVKLDMFLARDIHLQRRKQTIVESILAMCRADDTLVICEGVETREELETLREMGVRYFQGYLFSPPLFEGIPRLELGAA